MNDEKIVLFILNLILMNDDQIIEHLQTEVKPWVNKVPQPTFSNNIIRYKAGLLKPNTLKLFLEKLGYVKTQEGWVYPNPIRDIRAGIEFMKTQNG